MTSEELWLLNEKYDGEKTEGFFADCLLLKCGTPVAYLIGSIEFLHTTIFLDSHPLIPRTETEFWAERALVAIPRGAYILDLCAGSGCIGVAILKNVPDTRVDFAEIDTAHHSTIQKNISANEIHQGRTRVFGGDLFEHITDTYDFIVANPPYIDISLGRVDSSVVLHEPHRALYGGLCGTEFIARILDGAPSHLIHGGSLWLEHEPEQTEYIHTHARNVGLCGITHKDQYDVLRYTVMTRA